MAKLELSGCGAKMGSSLRPRTARLMSPHPQGSRIRVCGPMLGVVTETSGLPDPLTEPAKDETSVQTAGLF